MTRPPLHGTLHARALFCALLLALLSLSFPHGRGETAPKAGRGHPPAPSAAQTSTTGRFDPPVSWPADSPVMVHASVLPDGRVLFWGREKARDAFGAETIDDVVGRSKARIWNPATGGFEVVDNFTTNLFCSGHSLLPDGRLFAAGGHKHPHPNSTSGDERTNIFNPTTRTWSSGPTMPLGRWYPFTVALEDGKVAILSGTYGAPTSTNPLASQKQYQPEIYDPQTNTLELKSSMPQNPSEFPNYPYLFLDPYAGSAPGTPNQHRGVFVAGPNYSFFWNPNGGTDGKGSRSAAVLQNERHTDGTAVLYDSEEGRVLLTGGRTWASGGPTTNVAKTIKLNQDSPAWEATQPMFYPRTFHTSTLLPDGKVLVTGGVPCRGGHILEPCTSTVDINATKTAEMWDPATGLWTLMASTTKTRTYHSTALLLPDGRVLVGGGGLPDGMRAADGGDSLSLRRHTAGERNVEFFSPPYLFDAAGNPAPRPTINSAPAAVSYGQQFALTYGGASAVTRVAWVRLPSVTHGFNTDQRINVLQYTATPGVPNQLTVTAPGTPRKSPPGHYMLFVFNQNGTPSVAKIVRLGATGDLPEVGARVAPNADGRLVVFYRAAAGDLAYTLQTSPGATTWTAHTSLGGVITTNPVAVAHSDGRLHVFARGGSNLLFHQWQTTPGGAWSGWHHLGSGNQATSELAAARNRDGRLQVFFKGTDNALKYLVQTSDDPNAWGAQVNLGGGLVTGPSVAVNSDGRLEVFVVGLDNALYHNWQHTPSGGSGWSGFFPRGGYTNSTQLAATRAADGRLQVFYRGGADNALYYAKQSPAAPGGWGPHTSLGGVLTSDPAVGVNADGRLQVFVRGTDNGLHQQQEQGPGLNTWSGWAALGGGWTSPPSVARNQNGRLQLFVRGTNNAIYNSLQSAPNGTGWSAFAAVGGNASGF